MASLDELYRALTGSAEQRDAAIAQMHAETYPEGCNRGFGNDCLACAKRLGYAPVHCPICKAGPYHPKDGRVPAHNSPARGRRGYSRKAMAAFAPECSGTGKRAR